MQARANIVRFQIRKVDKNLRFGNAASEQLKNVSDTNTHAANAGTAATLEWVERDSVEENWIHLLMICRRSAFPYI